MTKDNSGPINVAIEKNYDSDFCGSIPLHLVNLIQPHGMLLVLDKEQLQIVQASENVKKYLSVAADELLEQPLSAYLPPQQFADIQTKIKTHNSQEKIPFSLTFLVNQKAVDLIALVHPREEYILVELEESTPESPENSF